jgi:hypothetical protein
MQNIMQDSKDIFKTFNKSFKGVYKSLKEVYIRVFLRSKKMIIYAFCSSQGCKPKRILACTPKTLRFLLVKKKKAIPE